ncbi:energy transducer TonB [Metapseudomonas resinovorans]|nr:energy transducer TonB [Pseudomonas resinovorans]
MAVQVPQPVMILLLGPEPAAAAAPSPPSPARPPARPATRTPPPEPKPQLVSKPRPEPAKPLVRTEPVSPKPRPASKPQQVAAASTATSDSKAPAASATTAAAQPAVTEVFSREPSFLTPPRPPVYPAQARRRNQQGQVLVEVRLDAKGLLREIRLLRSSGVESLDRSALDAVAAWRFRPETHNGQPVPSRVHIPIEFALSASR